MQQYKAAGYVRLSKEDKIKDESNSITNQKAIINSYIKNARDISEKVKSTLKVKQQNGDFIGTFAPYGYLKDPKDRHKLIIDKEIANIVRRIFDMILFGKSRKEIADFLNDNNILTPSLYKINKDKTNNEEFVLSKKWNAEIVNRILRNETYTGTLIQNIKTKPNYKNSKLIDVNKEDWIKTENHHEAIISKDEFDEVQKILDRKIKVNKNNELDLFSGYLKCFNCCEHLIIRKSKNKVYYYCSSYIKNKDCLKYSINKKKLEQLVIDELNNFLPINLEKLDRKILSKYINMIYAIDKDNIKIKFKNT